MKHSKSSLLSAISVSIVIAILGGCNSNTQQETSTIDIPPVSPWYAQGQAALQQRINNHQLVAQKPQTAKNVILFVGDGMGISTLTAARIFVGQQQAEHQGGEEYNLSFEQFPHLALVKTYNTDAQTPDSAGTMTAIMTGVKTYQGSIGIAPQATRGDCLSAQQYPLTTALELAKQAGMSAGIVTTSRVTHATPAATVAKAATRSWENDRELTKAGQANLGCKDIAAQLVEFDINHGLDVLLGGGKREFLDRNASDRYGYRRDGRNLIEEWYQARPQKRVWIEDAEQLRSFTPSIDQQIMGLFSRSHMSYDLQRPENEPSLAEMTEKAIEVLAQNPQGYFLMVEGARIDHAHHSNQAGLALAETQAFDLAVQKALSMTDDRETLILVTADHSHVMTMGGYAGRGNSITGLVRDQQGQLQFARDGKPYPTLMYANGPSADENGERQAWYDENIRKDSRYPSLVPLSSESHGAEDVALYAKGPGAHLVRGTLEQNVIFHIMNHAADLQNRAQVATR